MRIWHEELIPKLCRQHLLAVWREGLGAYAIITQNKKGYRNHPAVKEFEDNSLELKNRLWAIRKEMLRRGYNPKGLPDAPMTFGKVNEWQTLEEQIAVLKAKGCECAV